MSHEREMSDKDYAELWKPHENLRKQLAAAEALAAKWERIAVALANGDVWLRDANSTLAIANGLMGIEPTPPRNGFRWECDTAKGEWCETELAALLAWADTQKGA